MTTRLVTRILLFSLSLSLALPLAAAQSTAGDELATAQTTEKPARPFHPVTPGPTDGPIACLTARMLEELHYVKQPFDRSVSSKFLDRYLDSFDPQHVHFTQTDLKQFEHYRETLGDLTINQRGVADTRPACEIFNRFMERLQQRVAYADDLLKNEKFTFDADERILVNRKDQPFPKDLAEARQLWRERLRYEYLQEHLVKIDAKKKPNAAKKVDAKPKSESEEIVQTLTRRYHRNLRIFTDWDNDDVLQVYLTALAHVYDPHSDYYGHSQLEGFAIGMNLSLSGIGAELTTTDDGYCTIKRLLPEGPAEKSKKIKLNDRIIAVAQGDQTPVDVVEMRLEKAVQLIRGAKGTEVRLTIVPEGESSSGSKVVTLIRDDIKLEDQAAKAKIIDLPNGDQGNLRLGVIDLPSFYAPFEVGTSGSAGPKSSTSVDVARLLKKLKEEKVGGVILDLRRNGGGSLEEAIKLTGLFIKQGPVVQVRDSNGTVAEDADKDPGVAYDGPLIVLTSRFSASASEIVAGALQDYGRALLVGDSSTHGKGTVQSVNNLRPYLKLPSNLLTNDPGALKLTIKKFYRASGASTQKEGVVPDIVLPSTLNESKEIGEASLENALAYDTIPSAKYDHMNRVVPYLQELRKRSAQRVNSEKDFAYIREDIEQVKKAQADKSVSLNEKQRLKEKQEIDARQKARDKERLARKEPDEKVYELTLRQVDLPGLPPPVVKTNAALAKLSRSKEFQVAGVSTNSASAQVAAPTAAGDSEEPDELKPDGVDVSMVEAEHILVDYLSVLPKQDVVTTTSRRVN